MKSIVKSLLMSILIYIINHHIKHTTPLHPLLHTQPHPSSYFLLQAGWQHLATSWLKLFEELLNSNIYNPHNKSLGYIRTLGFEDWVSPDVISIYIYICFCLCQILSETLRIAKWRVSGLLKVWTATVFGLRWQCPYCTSLKDCVLRVAQNLKGICGFQLHSGNATCPKPRKWSHYKTMILNHQGEIYGYSNISSYYHYYYHSWGIFAKPRQKPLDLGGEHPPTTANLGWTEVNWPPGWDLSCPFQGVIPVVHANVLGRKWGR